MIRNLLRCSIVVATAVVLALNGSAGAQTAVLDPALSQLLQTALPGQLIEAVVTFQNFTFGHAPTDADVAAVGATGVQVLRFQRLPMVGVRGTASQISSLSALSGVRSIYANRQLAYFLNQSVPLIGADRVWTDLGFIGRGAPIAVIDTGIDTTHPDLPYGSKVLQNVTIGPDLFGTGPLVLEDLSNTDTTSGHGTHVSSTAAGTGVALSSKYRGVAIGAKLVGVGAGDALFVLKALEGFDWVLHNQVKYGIRVISNSWGTTGAFSADDPINVASKLAHDSGLVVVFAAGNAGPDLNTLNPYCVAPWVICVAAGLKDGQTLADFSSRGIPGDPVYHPTITAPGVNIVAARATTGIVMNTFFAVDLINIGTDALYYAAASGTSMATPHVSGTVALMLEANPALMPDQVKSILIATATPMLGYAQHEVGAGYLNAYAAVKAASLVSTTSRIEDTSPAVSYTGSVAPRGCDVALFTGCTAMKLYPGATATVTFTGTTVRWIGLKCNVCGIATVSIDGGAVTTVDTAGPAAPWSPGLTSDVVFTSQPLAAGSHTMVITNTGNTSSGGEAIGVDAFDVTSALTRFEETAPSVTYTGTWTTNTDFVAWSGGSAAMSNVAGSRATLTFTGTAVSWVSVTCEICGIANVYVDGTLKGTVDLYSATRTQGAFFTATRLTAGSHTLAIEVTGTKNPASTDAVVAVDAFDVTSDSTYAASPLTRFEETDPSVTFAGTWMSNTDFVAWSGGSAMVSDTTGSRATFTFTSTAVSWVSVKCDVCGIANVYVDGILKGAVDLNSATNTQGAVFTVIGLSASSHTLAIEVTGLTTNSYGHAWIAVDAFDVTR